MVTDRTDREAETPAPPKRRLGAITWDRIVEILRQYTPLGFFMEASDPKNSVTFTIAMIALAAKLAKADGQVTTDEVAAFREIFIIEPEQEAHVARVFNLCRQDVAGYEDYARQIVRLFGPRAPILEDILDALFHIAMADGIYHHDEDAFLKRVAEIFGMTPACVAKFKARYVPDFWDPYSVLGVEPGIEPAALRRHYREMVRQNHPDVLTANGLPEEMIELAARRLADINRAYEEIAGKTVPAD